MIPLIKQQRDLFHRNLIADGILSVDAKGIPSNADKDSRLSRLFASVIAERLQAESHEKIKGQSSGSKFEVSVMQFLRATFLELFSLRPGKWHFIMKL